MFSAVVFWIVVYFIMGRYSQIFGILGDFYFGRNLWNAMDNFEDVKLMMSNLKLM